MKSIKKGKKRIVICFLPLVFSLFTIFLPGSSTFDYNSQSSIKTIYENFLTSINIEKYYAGAYWEGTPFLLDENGEYILEENGRPMKNYDRDLYILVTNIKAVPREFRNHPKIFFRKVKYSEAQLTEFMEIILEHFSDECSSIGIDTIENKIHIYFSSEFDKKELYKLIPKDAYSYEYGVVSGEGL